MAETNDVVIVGGGAAGCSVAYYLGLAGVKSTIIERDGIASQASGFSAGGLNPLQGTGIPGPLSAVAMESYLLHRDLFPTLKEATGVDYQWRINSLIKAALRLGTIILRCARPAWAPGPARRREWTSA